MSQEPLAIFSEDIFANDIMAKNVDAREYLYSHNEVIQLSSINPIVWDVEDTLIEDIPDILDKGDRVVSKVIMESIMAWDPYGLIFMPAALKSERGLSEARYLMCVNNIIDVMDEDESIVYWRDRSDYDLPDELVVRELYISESKYNLIPECKRHVFRVKGADDKIFFSTELVNKVWDIAVRAGCRDLVQEAFHFHEETPGY
ncbi:DUF1629 domain-containing protein [uncultured Photobacterium sp.]|uniref:imm11 family protein n=1 Tax=uncultured Photobacterium sp. TaxID=173973 RepID=UPI00262A591A|nr:DUF1629 domain-containing protein [uncultured Photobacterium sp.]